MFCLLVVLVELSVLAKWLARNTPLKKPNRGEGIVSRKPRPKSAHDFLGLLYCFIVLLCVCVVSCPYVTYYPTVMARYGLFVLKVPLNPKQASKQTNNTGETPSPSSRHSALPSCAATAVIRRYQQRCTGSRSACVWAEARVRGNATPVQPWITILSLSTDIARLTSPTDHAATNVHFRPASDSPTAESCRVIIQQQFWMKESTFLGGQNILRPLLHIFRGSGPPTPSGSAPLTVSVPESSRNVGVVQLTRKWI